MLKIGSREGHETGQESSCGWDIELVEANPLGAKVDQNTSPRLWLLAPGVGLSSLILRNSHHPLPAGRAISGNGESLRTLDACVSVLRLRGMARALAFATMIFF